MPQPQLSLAKFALACATFQLKKPFLFVCLCPISAGQRFRAINIFKLLCPYYISANGPSTFVTHALNCVKSHHMGVNFNKLGYHRRGLVPYGNLTDSGSL